LDNAAVVTIRDVNPPRDSAVGTPLATSFFAPNRATTFNVRIAVPGYRVQTRDIAVPAVGGTCPDIETQRVVFDMVRLTSPS
jgi:hypothetical protein